MVRRLLAFVLLFLIGGGLGWTVYERQYDREAPPADDVATAPATGQPGAGSSAPETATRADAVPQAQPQDDAPTAPAAGPRQPSGTTTELEAKLARPAKDEAVDRKEPDRAANSGPRIAPRTAQPGGAAQAEGETTRPEETAKQERTTSPTVTAALPEAAAEAHARAETARRSTTRGTIEAAPSPREELAPNERATGAGDRAPQAAPRQDEAQAALSEVEGGVDLGSASGARQRWEEFRSLGLDAIRRAFSGLTGGDQEPRAAAPPPAPGPEQALADLKGDPQRAVEPTPLLKPSFDIVRISRDGRAVIAGRAEPGAEVEVRVGKRVIDRVVATRRGSWVSRPSEAVEPGDQELSLAARVKGGSLLESDQIVVVAVPEAHPPQPPPLASAEPPPEPRPRVEPAALEQEAVASDPAPATVERQAGDPVAILMRKDEPGSGRVLQAPGWIGSGTELALMVLDYDDSGRIRLSGEGPAGAPVRVYVDNRLVGEFRVSQDGTWRTVLDENLEPGSYVLRLDQLDAAGRPVARLETPFTRASRPPVAGRTQVDYVIVQPGNSLWRIARRLFGRGFEYVHIFEANKGQIRDPDLIYPGQVFEVPVGIGAQG